MGESVRSPLLVGRAAESRLLDDALGVVRAGGAATAIVGGDAGIGKSRLVEEFAARHPDVRVLTGGCVELGADGLPFAPFVAALRGLAADLDVAERARLGPLLPGLPPPANAEGEQSRPRLFEAVLTLLARLAAGCPVVFVIEDVHWADRSSVDLLEFLVRNQRAAPGSLLVVTHRADEPTRPALRGLLAGLGRLGWVRRLQLAPLTHAEIAAQVGAILGRPADPALIATVQARSDGNPLFVEALLDDPEAVPGSLADLLATRVARLGPNGSVVRAAAIGGMRVEHAILAAVCGAPVDNAVRRAIDAAILVVDEDGYRFRHALVRDAVLTGVLPGERTALHRRYADVLRDAGGSAAELSHHLSGAKDGPGAVAAAWAAAAQARRSLAHAEDLQLLERVLRWWDAVPGIDDLVGVDRATALEKAAEAAARAGEHHRAEELATAALAAPGVGRIQAAALRELRARMRHRAGRPDAEVDLRVAIADTPRDHDIRPYLLNALAAHLMDVPSPEESRAVALEALAAAPDDGPAAAAALITLATLDAGLGDLDAQLPRLATAREIATKVGADQLRLLALQRESHLLHWFGRLTEAERVARAGIAAAADVGLSRSAGPAHAVNLAAALCSAGRWHECDEVVEQALTLVPPPAEHAHLLLLRSETALGRGTLDLAERLLDRAAELIGDDRDPVISRLLARLHLARGHSRAVDVVTDALGDHLLRTPRLAWPLLVVGMRAAATDPALAGAVRATASALPQVTPPQAAHAAAVAALGTGTPSAWEVVVATWERLSHPFELAEALHALGGAQLAAGDRAGAASALARSLRIADDLGARPLRAQIADLVRRARLALGPHADAGSPADAATRIGLTPRESEVLRLVADGLGNADIAARLFISAKTASVHVSNILGKLEVSNRVEAAAAARRLGLVSDRTAS